MVASLTILACVGSEVSGQMLIENSIFSSLSNCIKVSDNQARVKTYAIRDNSRNMIAVAIFNDKNKAVMPYTIRFSMRRFVNRDPLKINLDARMARQYHDVLLRQSKVILIFDTLGNIVRKYDSKTGKGDWDCKPMSARIFMKEQRDSTGQNSYVLSTHSVELYSYQWTKDKKDLKGENYPSIKVQVSGNYAVKVRSGMYEVVSPSVHVEVPKEVLSLIK